MFFVTFGKPKSILDLKSELYIDSIQSNNRDKANIIIIDDQEIPYLETLKRHGFKITEVRDMDDIKILETFEIIMCDIRGVGRKLSTEFEGAHLIKEIKKKYPFKYVISYTAHTGGDTKYSKYFKYADDVVRKDISSDQWIELLDTAISVVIDPVTKWKKVRSYLLDNDVSLFNILNLENEYVESILNKSKRFPSSSILGKLPPEVKSIMKVFAQEIIKLAVFH